MTLTSEHVTRWIVIAVLGLATVAMFAISMRGNYLYGYSVGQSNEKRALFAWANVAADAWKGFGLIAITMLWRHRHRRVATAAVVAWLVCLLSGVNSAIGVYVHDRAALTGTREVQFANYKDAEKELGEIEGKLKALSPHRSLGEIGANMAAVLARTVVVGDRVRGTVGTFSGDCKKTDARTADACAEITTLRSERAIAEEATRLETRAEQLRTNILTLRERGSSLAPDPVGEFYAWATGGVLSVRDVGFGFPLFFALLIEIVSAFGPMTVVRLSELNSAGMTRPDSSELMLAMARHGRPWPARLSFADERGEEHVAAWMSERATPRSDGGATTVQELHEDYLKWCRMKQLRGSSLDQFAEEFDGLREMPEVAGKIRKFGNRYYGITLVQTSIRELPVQSR
jgi:hypothetical protein